MAYTTIDDPSAYFQTKIYTGNNTDGTQITNDGSSNLQPDWLWIKNRTDAGGAPATGGLWDSVRGFAENKVLTTFSTNEEGANSNGFAVATTNGFTVEDGTSGGNPRTATNLNAKNYVAWQWKAGTSFTNDASSTGIGTIDSTASVNQTAGFSIVSFTGNATAGATIAHGLGAVPSWILLKDRDLAKNWNSYHKGINSSPQNFTIRLNNTDAKLDTPANGWNDTAPTSSVFSIGDGTQVNTSGSNMIAYIFAEKKGYSKFGSYTGNGNADGTFVYTGFKPAWIMYKNSESGSSNWEITDNKRAGYNSANARLLANTNGAEDTGPRIDILSNGFKHRSSGNPESNKSGEVYIFMCFAESPFVSSTGVPATAR